MSIYIPDIAPPENCDKCMHPTCTLWKHNKPGERHEDCPIIEVHDHGDLIDRVLLSVFYYEDSDIEVDDFDHGVLFTLEKIDEIPPTIPADERYATGEPKREYSCDTCRWNPPSSFGGKPCSHCDTDDPLMNCWQRKEDTNGND